MSAPRLQFSAHHLAWQKMQLSFVMKKLFNPAAPAWSQPLVHSLGTNSKHLTAHHMWDDMLNLFPCLQELLYSISGKHFGKSEYLSASQQQVENFCFRKSELMAFSGELSREARAPQPLRLSLLLVSYSQTGLLMPPKHAHTHFIQ